MQGPFVPDLAAAQLTFMTGLGRVAPTAAGAAAFLVLVIAAGETTIASGPVTLAAIVFAFAIAAPLRAIPLGTMAAAFG
ncbi:hypothetical protein C1X81_34735, partial [Pseudomonas sp. FW215-L2]